MMDDTEGSRIGLAWLRQHPVVKGLAYGVVALAGSVILISFAPPAWAFSFAITERITVDLGSLPPWVGAFVFFITWWEARKARKLAAESVKTSQSNSQKLEAVDGKIDGMLADRDKANVAKGELKGKVAGEDTAAALAQGQREGRDAVLAGVAAATSPAPHAETAPVDSKPPLPVADEKVGKAVERSAKALETSAKAITDVAKATEEKK